MKNAEIARDAGKVVDEFWPIDGNVTDSEASHYFTGTLGLVVDANEFRDLLTAARSGPIDLLELTRSKTSLQSKLGHPDRRVRLSALNHLTILNEPEAWNALGALLPDPELGRRVAESIIAYRHAPLFGAALRVIAKPGTDPVTSIWPFNYEWPWSSWPWRPTSGMSIEDPRQLLSIDDVWVDCFWLPNIWLGNHIELLDSVVEVLNKRPSAAAKVAVEQLLLGPWPFGQVTLEDVQATDPMTRPPLSAARREPWEVLSVEQTGTGLPSETTTIIRRMVELGRKEEPECWTEMQRLTERWIEIRGSDWWVAGFVQAMKRSDSKKTQQWLQSALVRIRELDPGEHRFISMLAGVGAVADPELLGSLDALIQFRKTAGQPSFNGHTQGYFDYARHRCRQIHKWKLRRKEDGKFVVVMGER